MYVVNNPVLQRELLFNLRRSQAFLILAAYIVVVAGIVLLAWPQGENIRLDDSSRARRLFDLFMIGQFVLVSLLTPAIASGSVAGEKERKTYEMLLASPLRPAAILLGKLISALCYLAVLIFSTLPIVMICLPLGGVNFFELIAAYVLLTIATGTFGMISLACSTYFQRTASALVVSYLLILPVAILGSLLWSALGEADTSTVRLVLALFIVPVGACFLWGTLFFAICGRLLYPPDLGSEGKEVVDEEHELAHAVGMVIQRDQFPDNLFAPSRRTDLMSDSANPVFDKELRSEIFSGGTLMARLVIQVSMFLAIPLMAIFLFFQPQWAAYYVSYVILFNLLVGPVFMAGSITSERERETLDLLLTTNLTASQILWPKWLAGLRVSTVLTSFLTPPLILAALFIAELWPNWPSMLIYFGIILMTCLTTATLALFCSVCFRRTSVSQLVSYLVLIVLFTLPVAVQFFIATFVEGNPTNDLALYVTPQLVETVSFTSPFSAAFSVPLEIVFDESTRTTIGGYPIYRDFFLFYVVLNMLLLLSMWWLFQQRWRVAQ